MSYEQRATERAAVQIGKSDTNICKCGKNIMTGTHVVEECSELDHWRTRRAGWKDWREALGGRAVSKKEALGAFFYRVYEFFFSFSNPPPIIHRPSVPARYVINFVPATNAFSSSPSTVVTSASSPVVTDDFVSVASTAYSVVSSVVFVRPATHCITTST